MKNEGKDDDKGFETSKSVLVLNNDISALEQLLNLFILIFSHPNKGNDYCVHKGR